MEHGESKKIRRVAGRRYAAVAEWRDVINTALDTHTDPRCYPDRAGATVGLGDVKRSPKRSDGRQVADAAKVDCRQVGRENGLVD